MKLGRGNEDSNECSVYFSNGHNDGNHVCFVYYRLSINICKEKALILVVEAVAVEVPTKVVTTTRAIQSLVNPRMTRMERLV
jgi:hypothetical protein